MCHALGSHYGGKHLGNFGSTGSFSFYPTKQITTGEGGMLVTNDLKLFNKINKLKAFGIDTPPQLRKKPGIYDIKYLGFNYRMTDFQAAMGLGQLLKYKKYLKIRKRNAKIYYIHFIDLSHLISLPLYSIKTHISFSNIIENKLIRDKVATTLKKIKLDMEYNMPLLFLSSIL